MGKNGLNIPASLSSERQTKRYENSLWWKNQEMYLAKLTKDIKENAQDIVLSAWQNLRRIQSERDIRTIAVNVKPVSNRNIFALFAEPIVFGKALQDLIAKDVGMNTCPNGST